MNTTAWKQYIQYKDASRDLVVPGDNGSTLDFCVNHFITSARNAIEDHGSFSVALSGGSTPATIFERLSKPPHSSKVDWRRVILFWSDERSVPPTDKDSNYRMAMDAGLKLLPIPPDNIFRMHAEQDIEKNALEYEKLIRTKVSHGRIDLVTLGMGDDGHTASLFPETEGLAVTHRLVIANFVPQKNTWRMTMTYEGIHLARNICVYVLGEQKKHMLNKVLTSSDDELIYPAQKIGTPSHRALWIADQDAASELIDTIR